MDPIKIELGDGLVLRQAVKADTERVAEFNEIVHSDEGAAQPFLPVGAWVRDLMERHPTTQAGDFLLVEDIHTGTVVSSLCTIPQTWTFAGIPFKVGRPELVGTLPEYRRKGLVRRQFEILHQWGDERGEMMQVITGIPNYYRQFGYEMALELHERRTAYPANLPKRKPGETEPYQVRPAVEEDIPFIETVYAHAARRSLFAAVRDHAVWLHELCERSPNSVHSCSFGMITTTDGEPVGMLTYRTPPWDNNLQVPSYELAPGASWAEVTPSVLRFLRTTNPPWESVRFNFCSAHPLYELMPHDLPKRHKPYAWYIRIPDLRGFLWHVREALEQRLAGSTLAGYTGNLDMNFYRSGLRLVFKTGILANVEPWVPSTEAYGHVTFPGLTFLSVLCGYKSLEETETFLSDCYPTSDLHRLLVNTLFPKQPSQVWGIV